VFAAAVGTMQSLSEHKPCLPIQTVLGHYREIFIRNKDN